MRDSGSEQDYPLRPPRRRYGYRGNGRRYHFNEEEDEAAVDEAAEDEDFVPLLPPGGTQKALIIGAGAGILCALQSIAITLFNAPTYQAYDTATQPAVKQALAFTTLGYAVLTFFVSLLIYLIAGFITGKVAVQRRRGFLEGFVAGAITYLASFITHYIPNYPGNQHTAAGVGDVGSASGGLLVILILLLLWGLIGGLVSLLGAWLATRRNPFYDVGD